MPNFPPVRNTLGLFETDAQLVTLLDWQAQTGEALDLVALTAVADYAAERHGVAWTSVEDHIDEAAIMAEGIEHFGRLGAFCTWLDRFLSNRLDEDVSPWFGALDFSYSLKLAVDRLYYRTILLNRLLMARRPARVIGFSSEFCQDDAERRQNMLPHRSTAMTILPVVAAAHGIEAILLPSTKRSLPPTPSPSPPDVWDELLRQVDELRAKAGRPVRLLILGPYWSAHELPGEMQRQGMPVVSLPLLLGGLPVPMVDEQAIADCLWEEVRHSEAYHRLLTFDGIDVAPFADPAFATVVRGCLPCQRRQVPILAQRFRELGDAVLLTSSLVLPSNFGVLRAARAAGTPSVLLQHGGMWYFNGMISYFTDPRLPDYYLCYGEGSAHAIQDMARSALLPPDERHANLVPSGCHHTHRMFGKVATPPSPERGVRVLYTMTSLSKEDYYLSGNRHADIWYWRLQRDVVQHCAALPGVELTVRPAPGTNVGDPLHDWLFATQPKCRYAPSGSLEPLLLDADIIVIDYTSSILLQASASMARIVTLFRPAPLSQLAPAARDALARRAWIADSREAFLAAIDAAVADCRDNGEVREFDREFVTRYGCPPDLNPITVAATLLKEVPYHSEKA